MATKHAAELFALLVNDLYGELPSRVLAALLDRGRSTIAQLTQHTTLNPRHVKHGLSVLIQQNLTYHFTPRDSRATFYEANVTTCYNLLRTGKVLAMIGERYGRVEEDVAQALLLLGHVRIGDLETRVLENLGGQVNGVNGHVSELPGGKPLGQIRSVAHLHHTLYSMLRADLLDVVGPRGFQSAEDIYRDLESELNSSISAAKLLSNKGEQERVLGERFREAQNESNNLKRQLDPGPNFAVKRRRLFNGDAAHIHGDEEVEDDGPYLDTDFIIRLNFDKCLVELRNQSLAQFAADSLGEVTGQIFLALLRLLTAKIPKCGTNEETAGDVRQNKASTLEIISELGSSVLLSRGIGKAKPQDIDLESAERIRVAPGADDADSDASDTEAAVKANGNHADDDGSDEEMAGDFVDLKPHTNGKSSKPSATVTLDTSSTDASDDRVEQARQHLFILAESRQRFVRHCGKQGQGQWTVDFGPLLQRLRETEMDSMIEQAYGRHGLRLTRILRQKGKVEERVLPGEALMKKTDMQAKLLVMQVAGIVDLQEVPKDNQRIATRTMFFWYFDGQKCRANLMERIFKTMVNCYQRLEVERHKEQHLLSFVSRTDVMGREEEVMVPEHFNKYRRHLEAQRQLVGQLMRLDETVSIMRDY